MIIGVTGKYASGKGEIVSYLRQKGFGYFSFSAMMEQECMDRKLTLTRDNTILVANEMRAKHGNTYWAKRIISQIQNGKNYVVESFRNPDEVWEFKKLLGFKLLLVEAPQKTRFERVVERKRNIDTSIGTLEKFRAKEEQESKSQNKSAQQLDECAGMADLKIENNGTLEQLHKKIDDILEKIEVEA